MSAGRERKSTLHLRASCKLKEAQASGGTYDLELRASVTWEAAGYVSSGGVRRRSRGIVTPTSMLLDWYTMLWLMKI